MTLHHLILGQGAPLIILHGLFGSMDNWMSMAKNLAASSTVCLVDLRNHGQSFHDHQFNYEVMANDLGYLLNDLNFTEYSILGHSMGGKVAMFHATRNPNNIQKLIIVDIAPKKYPVHHQQILDGLSTINPKKVTSRGQADDLLKKFVLDSRIRQFLLKNLKRSSNRSFEWKINLKAISKHIDAVGDAFPANELIQIPTLFIRGGSSEYIREEDYMAIHKQFPQSTINTVPEVGHWIHAEAPRVFLEMVQEFLLG
jgi:pimeloyl-ACP methyl ester carboxylesterase